MGPLKFDLTGGVRMQKTWKPLTAGILDIIAGGWTLCGCLVIFLVGGVVPYMARDIPTWVPVLLVGLAIPFAILAVVSIIGGVFAIRRKTWGWALAGSITAVLSSLSPLGIAAVVLVAMSRNEF
jgi:hypothetical protein